MIAMNANAIRLQELQGHDEAPEVAPPPPVIYRPKQAAALCGISVDTLAKWPIRMFTFGNVTGYRRQDLEEFVAQHLKEMANG